MSSSDDDTTAPWVSIAKQPDWQDLEPIEQPISLSPVVAIKYTTQVKELYSYFRAIRAAKELSSRALWLTQEVIYVNSADYTAWAYRWQCLESLGNLDDEMVFIKEMASRSPKNYQLWNHRRKFAFKRGASYAQEELAYAADCLAEDAKNYHAWSHRQAIVRHFGLWQQEFEAVHELLVEDVRNNSAWNQRFFIISESAIFPDEREADELQFVKGKILECPYNESSWSYFRGLLSLPDVKRQHGLLGSVASFTLQVLEATPSCPPALTLLGDICTMGTVQERKKCLVQHLHILQELYNADPLRCPYWKAQVQHLVDEVHATA
ncbi:TPA: CAAX geranylgeranyltransferase alpha subunit [Trebouxia sp. C0004]